MKYNKVIMLKNGMECCLRNGMECDGQAVFDNFNLTHGETDYLLTYPDENCFDVMQESQFLKEKSESKNEIEIMRLVGASNIAIKLPFIFEGFILGVLGSVVPILATIYGYNFLYDKLDGHVVSNMIMLVEPFNFVFYVALILLAVGSIVGMFGSYRAVRKYLKI